MPKGMRRILYLTGAIEPHREGISKEVFTLHQHFTSSYVIGTSPDGRLMKSANKYLGVPARLLPTMKYWVPLAAYKFNLLHIFQGIDCYHYLKVKGRKPLLLTAISVDNILTMDHYRKVNAIVVESLRDRNKLIDHGFHPDKLAVVYPGSDLSLFKDDEPPPSKKFTILFASSAFSVDYMEPRGIRLLLETAKLRSDIDFVLLWRKRGDTLHLLQQWIAELSLNNVSVINEDIKDISLMYRKVHAAIVPFTSQLNTKSCPNSIVESLASGRPVLVSNQVGIADVVQAERCGVVFKPDPESLVEAISNLQQGYCHYQRRARPCAIRHFDNTTFLASYTRLYQQILHEAEGDK